MRPDSRAVRVRPAHRDYWRSEPHPEHWLLVGWPRAAQEPLKYWLSNLSAETPLRKLVELAKHRWIVERDYLELKQELGLGHFEGRSRRGFHHHATLCLAAYGFLVAERSRISASARAGRLELREPPQPTSYQPRGGARMRPPRGSKLHREPAAENREGASRAASRLPFLWRKTFMTQ